MADYTKPDYTPPNQPTYVQEPAKSGSTIYFILGALVVAVALIGWSLSGGSGPDTPNSAARDTNTNVTIEAPAANPAATPDATAPAEAVPAPAESMPAPATGSNDPAATAPAAPTATTPAPATPAPAGN